jgi:hypothetical protein
MNQLQLIQSATVGVISKLKHPFVLKVEEMYSHLGAKSLQERTYVRLGILEMRADVAKPANHARIERVSKGVYRTVK